MTIRLMDAIERERKDNARTLAKLEEERATLERKTARAWACVLYLESLNNYTNTPRYNNTLARAYDEYESTLKEEHKNADAIDKEERARDLMEELRALYYEE